MLTYMLIPSYLGPAPSPSCFGRMTATIGSARPWLFLPNPAPCPSNPYFASIRDPNPAVTGSTPKLADFLNQYLNVTMGMHMPFAEAKNIGVVAHHAAETRLNTSRCLSENIN